MKTVTSERCNVHTLHHSVKDFIPKIITGWPLILEFLDFLELFLDYVLLVKPLKMAVLDTIFLKYSLFFYFLWYIFSYICIFYTYYAKSLNFKTCTWFKYVAYAVAHMFSSNQCKQNSILCYDTLYAII